MDQESIYIKKLIAATLSGLAVWGLSFILPFPANVLAGFLLLGFLIFRITGEKPPYLYGLSASDAYLNKKGGLWLLLKWLTFIPGLVYDLLLWTFHGVYSLFGLILDVIQLIKVIAFWIFHAAIWFLRLLVPPVVLLYKSFLRYFIFWPWWIYRLSFRNMIISVSRASYLTALWGAVLSIFIFLLFFGTGKLLGLEIIWLPGAVLSMLPIVWAYTEIAVIRHKNYTNRSYNEVKSGYGIGMDALRTVLFYVVSCLVLLLAEVFLNLTGWMPQTGLSLLGVSLNINTLFSVLILFLLVILLFSTSMLPAHIVHEGTHNLGLTGAVQFLGIIGKRFLRFTTALLPASFFGSLLMILPAIVIFLAGFLTLKIKDKVIDAGITRLEVRSFSTSGFEKYTLNKKIESLKYYKDFPMNAAEDFTDLRSLKSRKINLEKNVEEAHRQLGATETTFRKDIDSLQNVLLRLQVNPDTETQEILARISLRIDQRKKDFGLWKDDTLYGIQRMNYDIRLMSGRMIQLPLAFLFIILWVSVFGGIVFAVLVSYYGHVFYDLYRLKEDGKPTYIMQLADEMKSKDKNQPLLGFTILLLLVLILWQRNFFADLLGIL